MHSVCPFTAPATTRSLRNNGLDAATKTSLLQAASAKTGFALVLDEIDAWSS